MNIVLQIVVLAFAAGGAWMAVKASAKAAHGKIDALTQEVRTGFEIVHKRLDAAGLAAKQDASNVRELGRRL
ncbi:MAG: hypothetical protein ACRD1F_01725 [Terriglobales bacterium]